MSPPWLAKNSDAVADGTIINQGDQSSSAVRWVLVFPSLYCDIAAALEAGVVAYLFHKRVLWLKITET